MKKYFLLIWFAWWVSISVFSQGLNNLWMMGYASWSGLPFGTTEIGFQTLNPVLNYAPQDMNFGITHANISTSQNDLLFYTNGIYIANRNGILMQNGNNLNPSWFTDNQANGGLDIPQAALIIPHPSNSNIYYLFHSTIDSPNYTNAKFLYLTTINMSLNSGLGAVTNKNQPLISDNLNPGMISAAKHGNGRDWWVFCHQANTNVYYRFLVSPSGITGPFQQQIGIDRPHHKGQVAFSLNGNRFAYHNPSVGLEVMDFDRCTGILSNPVHITLAETYYEGGVEFSSNSDLVYVSTDSKIFQFNLLATDIATSQQLIATWDGSYDPFGPPLATLFNLMKIAPDGKIYITTGNSTRYLHVIHEPNNIGLSSTLIQRGLELPTLNFNTLPNHPNYHLGPLVGSPCDTLTTASADLVKQISIQLYPNPNNGEFNLSFAPQPDQGQLQVYDVLGKLVHQEAVAQWSQVKRLSLLQLKQGVYHCRLSWGEKSGVVRFVKE